MLGFAAVNTGNNLLYLLVSALLGFMSVSGVLGKWNLGRVEVRYLPPDEFSWLGRLGKSMGFQQVASGPFVRSSYHAREMAELF